MKLWTEERRFARCRLKVQPLQDFNVELNEFPKRSEGSRLSAEILRRLSAQVVSGELGV
ncbi:MAG: hypothetical protein NTX25_05345 [Proteobacteria bacterium]|nr:hypothetical protein [Pseudomonadota bacterium]